jgi:hypothetical protein
MLGNQARVSKPIEITDRGILAVICEEENIHPARAWLHDVMRKSGNGV